MKIPENLQYTAEHLWIRQHEDGSWLAGITDYAQDLLGDIVYVEAPRPGSTINAGQPCGLVESVKTGSDLHSPLDGTVVAINEALQSTPEQINDHPYEAWIFSFKPAGAASGLLSAAEYQALLG
ncbi:glycine cleavage system protein GcvH [Methylobacillus arboreus]|uniref:glycine cleavage system protein GcvH n=1 Tax=Methylobacillus arboreus TaxID=755170 RepID=UPI001E2A98A5|nr:glycine cleavage system protein GcvH [Methylobacillus arboreus]MCB5190253.1 glycine cleavage system protein GcvH [Methylobacillus arboreus]